ncbi:MAG: metallophosphoesterase, partial [Asgard group archaeon]|nr:metallophosphoesterase [Asgard group archaeon]
WMSKNSKLQIINNEDKNLYEFIREIDREKAESFKKIILDKQFRIRKSQKRRKKFLESRKRQRKIRESREHMKIKLAPFMISQAIFHKIPLKEPSPKTEIISSEPETFLWKAEKEFSQEKDKLQKKYKKGQKLPNWDLSEIEYTPKRVYLQLFDDSFTKLLVKLFVDWGYLRKNKLSLFINKKGQLVNDLRVIVTDDNKQYLDEFPILWYPNLCKDVDKKAQALFVALLTNLESNKTYFYRLEGYKNNLSKPILATPFIKFQTPIKTNDKNTPFYFTVTSDLHAGRKAGFLRGKLRKRKIKGNKDLGKLYSKMAHNEQKNTFNQGYSLAITTGDLTENASYSEYWADLFDKCSKVWNHIPFLTAIGNHDYYCGGTRRGNIFGGLEEDCRYWHRYISNPYTNDGLYGHWYSLDSGNAHLVFLDSNGKGWGKYGLDCNSPQWKWLENDLRTWRQQQLDSPETTPDFCILFLHSAIMSLGFWGRGFNSGNDEKVQSYLTPLFKKYGVDLVFNGHDHIYQRSRWRGTEFIQNGRGGGSTRPFFYWLRKRTVYDVEKLCYSLRARIYSTVYVPPKIQKTNKSTEKKTQEFFNTIKNQLLQQPLSSNYYFGDSTITKKISRKIDRNKDLKESFIKQFILPKLNTNIWFRAYALKNDGEISERELIDMSFISPKSPRKLIENQEPFICPERVVE